MTRYNNNKANKPNKTVMRPNPVPRSARPTVVFNGGSATDFILARFAILRGFAAAGISDHVVYAADAVEATIVENVLVPAANTAAEYADGVIAAQQLDNDNLLATNLARVLGYYPGIAAATVAKRNALNESYEGKHDSKRMEIDHSRQSLEKNFTDLKNKFNDERKACMDSFTKLLGDNPLSIIRADLSQGRFRLAWFHLNQHYATLMGATSSTSAIINTLTTLTYDATVEKFLVLQQNLEALFTQKQDLEGTEFSDAEKLHYLTRIVATSPGQEFQDELLFIKQNGMNYQQALARINQRANELNSLAHLHVQPPPINSRQAGANTVTTGAKKCTKCGKANHTAPYCWKEMICDKCGMKGHIAKKCRTGASTVPNPQNVVSSVPADRFANNNKGNKYFVSSLFSAFPESEYAPSEKDIRRHRQNSDICSHSVTSYGDVTKVDQLVCAGTAVHRIEPALCFNLWNLDEGMTNQSCRVILDSGATAHMFPYKHMLCGLSSTQGNVYLGDGSRSVPIEGIGFTRIPEIRDVLYVPALAVGIISIAVLAALDCSAEFSGNVGIVYDHDREVILTATMLGNLYLVDAFFVGRLLGFSRNTLHQVVEPVSCRVSSSEQCSGILGSAQRVIANTVKCSEFLHDNANFCGGFDPSVNVNDTEMGGIDGSRDTTMQALTCANSGVDTVLNSDGRNQRDQIVWSALPCEVNMLESFYSMSTDLGLNPLEVLHRQWGHLGERNIKRALRLGMIKNCKYTYDQIKELKLRVCFDCLRGRMKAKASQPVTHHDWTPLQKIAVDFKGYFRKKSHHGYRGFLLFVDYTTNYLYVDLVKSKVEVLRAMMDFMNKVVKPSKFTWDTLQSDSDKMFMSVALRSWLRKNSITLQLSEPYVHWQNGQIEVYIGIVMDKARIMMCSYDVPGKYWEFAILTAVYLINRSPTSTLDMSPHEAVTGEKPDLSHCVPFFAPGVYYLSADERAESWSPKAELCRMLGYSDEHKSAYIVLNTRTGRVLTRGNCVFDTSLTKEHLEDTDTPADPAEVEFEELESDEDSEVSVDEVSVEDSDAEADDVDGSDGIAEIPSEPVAESESVDFPSERADGDDDHASTTSEEYSDDEPYAHYTAQHNDEYQCYYDTIRVIFNAVALPANPASVTEALAGPDGDLWRAAITKECDQFRIRSIWGDAEQYDTHGNTMKTKLILQYKYDANYELVRKARLVVCGYSQRKGIDYNETFSPTTTIPVVFTLLHLAAAWNHQLYSFDVSAAFLEGKADCDMYAWLPAELSLDGIRKRVAILGNWYGEKQAGKIWNELFNNVLLLLSFVRCPVMPCLYHLTTDKGYMLCTIHVDDAAVVTDSKELMYDLMYELHKHIRKVTLCEDVRLYLGMNIERTYANGFAYISVDQQSYIEDEFSEYHRVQKTPMSHTTNLRIATPVPTNESLLPDTGRFRYLADRCRPDILAAVGEVSTGGAEAPSAEHVATSKRIKNYLTYTKCKSLRFGGNSPVYLFAYCDAAYITDGKARSRLGGCIFLGYDSGAIRIFSKNDTTVSHSSTESEIKAIDLLAREIVHFRDILKFIGYTDEQLGPTKIYVDSRSAIELCSTLKTNHKVRHINMRIHYIRELINSRVIELHFIPTKLNVADTLTKPLMYEPFVRHTHILLQGHGGVSSDDVNILSHAFVFGLFDGVIDGRQQV